MNIKGLAAALLVVLLCVSVLGAAGVCLSYIAGVEFRAEGMTFECELSVRATIGLVFVGVVRALGDILEFSIKTYRSFK